MEEEYGKRLSKLAKNFTPLKDDKGYFIFYNLNFDDRTMLDSLDVIRNELERSARAHLDLALDLKSKIAAPLQDMIDSQAAVRKNVCANLFSNVVIFMTLSNENTMGWPDDFHSQLRL